MIRVARPAAEPPALRANRDQHLPVLEKLIATSGTFDPDKLVGYEVARDSLFNAQHRKCCYCEAMREEKYQAVEHYRPKSIHWWLTWTWSNLLFVCQICNGEKSNNFPLLSGSRLGHGQQPPGAERPTILDAADPDPAADPLAHIIFRKERRGWVPYARDGSQRGHWTIFHCGLDRTELLELYKAHERQMRGVLKLLRHVCASDDPTAIQAEWVEATSDWLSPSMPFTALSRDILNHHVQPSVRKKYGLSLDLTPPWTP